MNEGRAKDESRARAAVADDAGVFLGADLVWWRASGGERTRVTVYWPRAQPFADAVRLRARLLGPGGRACAEWFEALNPGGVLMFDSACAGPWSGVGDAAAILELRVETLAPASEAARRGYLRLFPFVDWCLPDGRLSTLHSDQVLTGFQPGAIDFTEIVVEESGRECNAMVMLTGDRAYPAGALRWDCRNAAGERRGHVVARRLASHGVHVFALADLFGPDIAVFAAGQPLQVSGRLEADRHFVRPYVLTRGAEAGAYHGGDWYDMPPLPWPAHAFVGGEVNPMAVIEGDGTATLVNLLLSHGTAGDELPVDAALYDREGRQVALRRHWLKARRGAVARGAVADLLPAGERPFLGHLALSFAPEPGQAVPRRLQALLEYRCAGSVSRVMAWSDEWNSRTRVALRARGAVTPAASYFRVFGAKGLETWIALVNAGHPGHRAWADVRIELLDAQGVRAEASARIAPFGTLFQSIGAIFPDVDRLLGPDGSGLVRVSSASDLANLGFTRGGRGQVLAAEHFLPEFPIRDGAREPVPGS